MWHKTFDQRLSSWYQLRQSAQECSLEEALEMINIWWFRAPWQPYYLHWDDIKDWPDPWQLLNDNVYCDLARGLGILYTITMLNRADTADAALVLTDTGYNLVQVGKRKYILNWSPDSIVNTSQEVKIIQQLSKQELNKQYN